MLHYLLRYNSKTLKQIVAQLKVHSLWYKQGCNTYLSAKVRNRDIVGLFMKRVPLFLFR